MWLARPAGDRGLDMQDPDQLSTRDLVARLRQVASLTQEELARELGVSFSTVNAWEGGRSEPQVRHRRKLQAMAASLLRDGAATHVLVVDDDEPDRRATAAVVADAAAMLGHTVTVVTESDPLRALVVLGRLQPRVAFLDIYLPIYDGFELADRLTEIEGLGEVTLAFVTAARDPEVERQAAARGLAVHDKPLTVEAAGAVLGDALGSPSTAAS